MYSTFFSLKNAVCFIILTYLVPVLFTVYIQCVLKLKKNISGAKRLIAKTEYHVLSLTYIVPFDCTTALKTVPLSLSLNRDMKFK